MDLTQPLLRQNMISFASSILKNDEDAQDVVQDVLAQCLQIQGDRLNKAYVFKAVRNHSLNRVRGQNRYRRAIEAFGESLKQALIDSFSADSGILDWVKKLPAKQQEVLVLRIQGELSNQEISEVLGIPEGTVKSRTNKALKNLKQKMKERPYERF